MKRRIFTILSAVSLLLFVATAVLWVRGYWVADLLQYPCRPWAFNVESLRGKAILNVGHWRSHFPNWATLPSGLLTLPAKEVPDYPGWNLLGFAIADTSTVNGSGTNVSVPMWFIASLLVVMPLCWFLRWRRNRLEQSKGLCAKCGYDLRASKERCPECGTQMAEG